MCLFLLKMREQLSERLEHLLASVHKTSGGESETEAGSASPCAAPPQVAAQGIEAREESDGEGQPPRRMTRPIATVDLSDAREPECSSGSAAAAAAVALAHNGHAEQCEQRAAAALEE